MQRHKCARQCSVTHQLPMSIWYNTNLCESKLFSKIYFVCYWSYRCLDIGNNIVLLFCFVFISQDTTMALWVPCSVLAATEVGLSVWCFIVGLALRGLTLCGNSYIKEQVCVWGGGRWICFRGITHTWPHSNTDLIHSYPLPLWSVIP